MLLKRKKYLMPAFAFLYILFHFSTLLLGQEKKENKILLGEKGLYPIYNYSTKAYHALPQNWAITQDKRGVMYFGNNVGILEYDGVSWRMIKVSNETNIRSLAIDDKGKIYVGASGEFGYLEPDSVTGNMRYISLQPFVEKNDKNFSDVWRTVANKEGIYFQADNKIFRWDGHKIKVWNAEKSFHRMFKVNEHLFIRESEIGLLELIDDKLVPMKGGEEFVNTAVDAMIPFPGDHSEQNILVCARKKGLYVLKPAPDSHSYSLEKYPTQADRFLLENPSSNLLKTGNEYSIATVTKGSVIIDPAGNLLDFLNKNVGLQDETIYSQYVDASGNLWLALGNGISRVAINSPVTFFSDRNGIDGTVQSIVRHNNVLFAATTLGVFYLRPGEVVNGSFSSASFQKLPSINEECWNLLSFKKGKYSTLLGVSSRSIFSVDNQMKVTQVLNCRPWMIYQSKFDSSRIFIGLEQGLASIYWDGNKWLEETMVSKRLNEYIYSIAEDAEGQLWLGHPNGVIKVKFKNNKLSPRKSAEDSAYLITKYDTTSGLLPNDVVQIENVNGKIIFGNSKGIYKLESGKFVPDDTYGKQFSDGSHSIYRIIYDKNSSNVWLETVSPPGTNKFDFGFLKKENDGRYAWNSISFLPYSDDIINTIFHDNNGITWFGGAGGLFRYHANIDENEKHNYNSLIRKVVIGKDSTIFNGAFYDSLKVSSLTQNASLKPILPFKENSIVFEFAARDFTNETVNQYQYYLEGFNREWSNWKPETKAVYTNLPEGKYLFHVRARNIFNQDSTEGTYEFTILPPWYRTWWAYICYVLLSFGFVWGVVTLSTRGLKAIILERTAEVVKQKEEIEYKNRNITDSINYAKRIQEAILPQYEQMRNRFPESFILYKPRDIVSGDFYWFAEKERKFIIAACDCTGHGVPGAFMSLIGYSLLNEVILEKTFTDPANALDSMKKGIIKSLGQTGQEGEQKDGMDMSLISLEVELEKSKVVQKLKYAGANNPLYIVRKGELIELNADKMPIGIYYGQDRPFVNKDVQLEPGDTFYLFSDGYADQFGGSQGKKFTKKRFKDLL
ncbi:MAG: two-component regulator propeller domain-containing protein, partial [Bacteroidia bacterium]